MSDQRLRELQRDPTADPVAVLTARLRAGELTLERIALAAYAGSESARGVVPTFQARNPFHVGLEEYEGLFVPQGLAGWVRGLTRWGNTVLVRAGIAAALSVPWRFQGTRLERIDAVVRTAEAWVACPCKQHADAMRPWWDPDSTGVFESLPWFVRGLVIFVWHDGKFGEDASLGAAIRDAAERTGETTVRAAACEALVKWALDEARG